MMTILLVIILFHLIIIGNGSHFLGGTITWHPLNTSATGTPVAIVITQTYSWTYSLITCTNAMIAASQLIPAPVGYPYLATQTLVCISNCSSGSIGYIAPSIRPYCTDISAPIGTTVGQRSDTVSLQVGDDFSAAFQQNAWRSLATAVAADWSISTHIIVNPRSDNGLYNNAPVATMMSPINIPANHSTIINVPVADADGDPTVCRWSTASNGVDECGGVCPPSSLPPNTVIYPNCTIVITGQNIGDWFAVTLMVEDFINSSSTTPLSSVSVQFLVHVVSPSSCSNLPQIVGLSPEQSCTYVIIGQTFTSQLIAVNYCGSSVTIIDIATLSFPGVIESSIAVLNATTYYKNVSWTPTAAQLGYQVICAIAFDSQGSQSPQYCFKLYAAESGSVPCPGQSFIVTTTTAATSISTTTMISIEKSASTDWAVIGSVIGIALLAALILCGFLYWFCCWLPAGRDNGGKHTVELYHIEKCTDPNCRWRNMSRSRAIFTVPRKNYRVYNAVDRYK